MASQDLPNECSKYGSGVVTLIVLAVAEIILEQAYALQLLRQIYGKHGLAFAWATAYPKDFCLALQPCLVGLVLCNPFTSTRGSLAFRMHKAITVNLGVREEDRSAQICGKVFI